MQSTAHDTIAALEAVLPALVRGPRLLHILSVRDFALRLNREQALGLDPEIVEIAALCHDLSKHQPPEEQLRLAREAGIPINAVEAAAPWILHQKTSAYLAQRDFGITDARILTAIAKHTTAAAEMSLFEKLIYCADSVEPLRDYPGVEPLRGGVVAELSSGYRAVLARTIAFVVERGLPIHPASLDAWNALALGAAS